MVQAALAGALDVVPKLLLGARTWSTGGRVDLTALAALRSELLAENHRRHVESIPAYARLSSELGVAPDGTYDGDQLLVSDDWFKGYDPYWPDGDLLSLTAWLAEVSTVRPVHPVGVDDLQTWRSALRADDVFVTLSSGTTGLRSLVPRDRMTLTALRSSSGRPAAVGVAGRGVRRAAAHHTGMGSGIQSGAAGMAAAARRSAHDDDWLDFVTAAVADAQPVVLYGSPSRLSRLLSGLGTSPWRCPPAAAW